MPLANRILLTWPDGVKPMTAGRKAALRIEHSTKSINL
jgi:hypothetical protein